MATPTPAEVLRRVIESRLLDVHTALPGRVESYDPDTQTADILPMIKNVVADPDGEQLVEDFPVIPSVPVIFPRGGGYFITFPIAEGDFVLLVFNEKSIDQFMEKGEAAHPVDLEKHGFSGAVAYPGFYPTDGALGEDGHADGMLMGAEEAGPQIFIDGSLIEFGKKGAGDKVPLDSKLQTELSSIKTAIDALKSDHLVPHQYVAPLIPASAVPTIPPAPSTANYTVGDTASELVTVDK